MEAPEAQDRRTGLVEAGHADARRLDRAMDRTGGLAGPQLAGSLVRAAIDALSTGRGMARRRDGPPLRLRNRAEVSKRAVTGGAGGGGGGPALVARRPPFAEALTTSQRSRIVAGPSDWVAQHVVGGVDARHACREALALVGVMRGAVGVMFASQLAPTPLDLVGRGVVADVEHAVGITAKAGYGHVREATTGAGRSQPAAGCRGWARMPRRRPTRQRAIVPRMRLPVMPPLEPMLAKPASELPRDGDWLFEPKWDGFRALVFRDGSELTLQSRDRKPLERYFPELVEPLLDALPQRCVMDGEVVIAADGVLDFEALLQRIHPAASRVAMLAERSPASYVAWDLLALDDSDLMTMPQADRRVHLEAALGDVRPPVYLTPITRDRELASDWFARFEGAGLDGVIAKDASAGYEPGKRRMLKIKHTRTADCVVAGFRWHVNGPGTHVGSLVLGLFDDVGVLHHVGVTSSFTWQRRAELVTELAGLREGALARSSVEGVGRLGS